MPEPDLALLQAAALAAGEVARARVGAPGAVHEKPGGHGPVTDTDLEVDRMLRAELMAARPGYGWLSEESEDGPERLTAERIFIVDPIDGTRAFLAGQKAWALSLAVAEAGAVVAGVVHLPMLGKTYAASRGGGATLNGRAIAASRAEALDGATVLATSSQMAPAFWPGGVPRFDRQFRPSLAYRLCLVAEGEVDATFTFRETWEWDVAAGDLIAREAGAVVTDRSGRPPTYNRPAPQLDGVIVGAPLLHAAILGRL